MTPAQQKAVAIRRRKTALKYDALHTRICWLLDRGYDKLTSARFLNIAPSTVTKILQKKY